MPSTRHSAGKSQFQSDVVEAAVVEGGSEASVEEEPADQLPSYAASVEGSALVEGVKASTTLLYFPIKGVPRLVDVPRSSLRCRQYRPYVDGYGRGAVCVTFMLTSPPDHYLIAYLEQVAAFQPLKNGFVTHMLEVLVGAGKKRPWYGPLLVEYKRENAFTVDNMKEEAVCVLRHLHTIYDRLHRDPLVVYDALPMDTSVTAVTPSEFFSLYRGDVQALLG
ncbi:hypothetical protein VNI00_017678 [Paramarasmius palmivorus]|uniref:Uncharacterized protein n=1 Tax=Paramarasmius palmivorus TaxID=297713 RepID=A0AAW0B5G9_9AGAR